MKNYFVLAALNLQWLGVHDGYIQIQKEGKTLSFESKAKKAEWLNWIESKDSAYLLYRTENCPITDCTDPKPLLHIRRIHPSLVSEQTLPYPGKITDHESGQILFKSRVFYGECLQESSDPVIASFQEERIDRRRGFQNSVSTLVLSPDNLKDQYYDKKLPKLAFTLKLLKSKKCQEIPGETRTQLKRKIDLSPSKAAEEEVQTKENKNETKDEEKKPTPNITTSPIPAQNP
jgi:hypothetical protein